jgi:uncharacterized membrane protein YhaH (DUF805 family)
MSNGAGQQGSGSMRPWWSDPEGGPPPPPPLTSPTPAPAPPTAAGGANAAWQFPTSSAMAVAAKGVAPGIGGAAVPAPPRTFGEAVTVCFRKYAVFRGRASRSEYWYFVLFVLTVTLGSVLVDAWTADSEGAGLLAGVVLLVLSAIMLASILPSLAVSVRRLHDVGRSGWFLLLGLVPILGSIFLLVHYTTPGDPGPNGYET